MDEFLNEKSMENKEKAESERKVEIKISRFEYYGLVVVVVLEFIAFAIAISY